MVKTRRKRNNTQKKRRNKQQKRNNTRKKLIMKKLFGGKNNICKCNLVGEGSSKKVYRYSLPVKDKLLVEIEVNKDDDDDDIDNAIIENLLLRQLHDKRKVPVVEVSEYTLNDKGNKTTISYFIEECGLNIEKKETTILIDLLKNGDIMNSVKFLEEIMNCSIFEVDEIQHKNNTLEGGLYLNVDCKSTNFCYQDNNSINPGKIPVVKAMDVGIDLLHRIHNNKKSINNTQTARLYVFILYCGLVNQSVNSSIMRRYLGPQSKSKTLIPNNLKKLSLELFKNTTNKEKIKMIQDISKVPTCMNLLMHYLLNVNVNKTHPYTDYANAGLTEGNMKNFLSRFMHKEFFEEKKQSIQNTEYTNNNNNIGDLKTVTPDSQTNAATTTEPNAVTNTVTP